MSVSEPMFSAAMLRELVAAVERAGVSRRVFLRAARLEALDSGETRIPFDAALRAHELAIELTGDPALGLHWSEQKIPNSQDLLGYLVLHTKDLRTAFKTLFAYSRLVSDDFRLELIESEDLFIVRSVMAASRTMEMFAAELIALSFSRLAAEFGASAKPRTINFAYPAPAHRSEYTRLLGPYVCFDQPFTELVFDTDSMDQCSRRPDRDLEIALHALAKRKLANIERPPYGSRVLHMLSHYPAPQNVGLRHTARLLKISPRTLCRRLQEEGASFHDLVGEASATLAKRLLQEERRSIQEVADAMGFSDRSGFNRAFKRWTGTTPSACRASPIRQRTRPGLQRTMPATQER